MSLIVLKGLLSFFCTYILVASSNLTALHLYADDSHICFRQPLNSTLMYQPAYSTSMLEFKKIFFFFKFFFNVYLFLRQRETAHEWGRVRERETQNLKQAPGSELWAQSPTRGSNSRTARSWPEPKSALNRLSHPGAPKIVFFKLGICYIGLYFFFFAYMRHFIS